MPEMKIAFHSSLVTERGSEGAMLDYARLNRSVLRNESVLCLPERLDSAANPVLQKWRAEFSVLFYRSIHDLGTGLFRAGVEAIYLTKPGPWDGFLVPGVRNCVHAQFLCDEFHGDAYAYLSPWMSRVMTGREESFVPFFVPRFIPGKDLREKLGIPGGARVFGRHGGRDTFNIPFVSKVVGEHAKRHPEDHFVFMNTEPVRGTEHLKNVHYLAATVDPKEKGAFLATCNAMLHARWHGETFGLAVGEFAVLGKPVITFGGSRERAHLDMLGEHGLVYQNTEDLRRLLSEFQPREIKGTGYEEWADAARVMGIFRKRFLD